LLSQKEKRALSKLFDDRLPPSHGEADAYLESESFQMFAPQNDGNLLIRFALTSEETLDLSVNPLSAARLAATLLDVLSKTGNYVVDLAIYDAETGEQQSRLRP
jgi:hypothetical protein